MSPSRKTSDYVIALKLREVARQLQQVKDTVNPKHLNVLGGDLELLVKQFSFFREEGAHHDSRTRVSSSHPNRNVIETVSKSSPFQTSTAPRNCLPLEQEPREKRVGDSGPHNKYMTLGPYLSPIRIPHVPDMPNRPLMKTRFPKRTDATSTYVDIMPASLYIALEAIVASLKAEKGAVYIYKAGTDHLVAVTLVGYGSTQPSHVRTGITSSQVGCVFSSGIASNVQNHQPTESMDWDVNIKPTAKGVIPSLVFPLRNFDVVTQTIGVVQIQNKLMGNANFSVQDEEAFFSRIPILSYILTRYPYDHEQHYFESTLLHTHVPWKPAQANALLPPIFEEHNIPQMIHRSIDTNTFLHTSSTSTRDDASSALIVLSSTPTLREIASYLNNLQDSWRHSVRALVDMEKKQDDRTELVRSLREEVRFLREENARITEQVRAHTITSTDYIQEYAKLDKELSSLLVLRKKKAANTLLMTIADAD